MFIINFCARVYLKDLAACKLKEEVAHKMEDIVLDIPEEAENGAPSTSERHSNAKNASRPKRARTKADKNAKGENTKRFHCNYCQRDLSKVIRARCAVCPDYDSCLDCFTVGAALKPHKRTHAYRLIRYTTNPVYQVNWIADEEERLLEGLESYGVGNWEDVAERHIKSKNAAETELHYQKVYLQCPTAPLPELDTMLPALPIPKNIAEDVDPKALRVMHKHQQEDIAGYMPKRQDFVYEYDNEAEEILGDMEIHVDDTPQDRELKLQVLDIYNRKLDERKRRKDFVLQRNLIDFKSHQASEKKRPKEERDLREKFRVFSRFISESEMERLINGIIADRKLRSQITAYQAARAHGATTVAEGSQYRNASSAANHKKDEKAKQDHLVDMSVKEVASMAGAELLGRAEITLCSSLKMYPHQYLIVKDYMIRENAKMGFLKRAGLKNVIQLDPAKILKIYDYLSACGWIRSTISNAGRNTNTNAAVTIPGVR